MSAVVEPVVRSVVRSQTNGPLLQTAAKLWVAPGDLVVDVTYGLGNFWTLYRPERLVAHDLYTGDGVDFRDLPEADESVDVVVFDPPYVAPGGRDSSGVKDMHKRYGMDQSARSPEAQFEVIDEGLAECERVLARGGRLLVKCMDYVWSGKLQLGRHRVVSTCITLGLSQVDEFVHVSGTGPQPPGRRQVHSRRAHSFLCVFQKPKARRRQT